jgi:hypothetical protein
MTVEGAIVSRLKADSAVSAIVGSRVYRLKLPQQPTLPAIRVQRVSRVEYEGHLRGRSGRFRSRIQIDAFASEYDSQNPDPLGTQDALMTAIDNAIVGKAFDSGDSPPTIQVWVVLSANAYEEYEAGELRQVRGPQDYFVTWSLL